MLLGTKGRRQRLSPLHAEMEALLWAMSSVLDKGIAC